MQEINTNQNLIPLAQFTSSKKRQQELEEREKSNKEERFSDFPSTFRQNCFFFSHVIVYCTVSYRMLSDTLVFILCKGKNGGSS